MDDVERSEVESLMRVDIFGDSIIGDIDVGSKIAGYFGKIKTGLSQLEQKGAIHSGAVSAKKSNTSRKSVSRNTLTASLRHIARFARIIEDEDQTFENKFIMPRSNLSTQALRDTARSFAADALTNKAKFVAYDMDADFVDELNEDLADFENAYNLQSSAGIQSVGANADIDDILDRMLDAKRKADPIVRYIYRNNPQKLAEWQTASHVERAQRKKKTESEPVK